MRSNLFCETKDLSLEFHNKWVLVVGAFQIFWKLSKENKVENPP